MFAILTLLDLINFLALSRLMMWVKTKVLERSGDLGGSNLQLHTMESL